MVLTYLVLPDIVDRAGEHGLLAHVDRHVLNPSGERRPPHRRRDAAEDGDAVVWNTKDCRVRTIITYDPN